METASVNQVNNATPVQQGATATKLQALFRGRSVRQSPIGLKVKYPSCSICLNEFILADKVAEFTCDGKHIFHTECAQLSANYNENCPACRAENTNPFGVHHISQRRRWNPTVLTENLKLGTTMVLYMATLVKLNWDFLNSQPEVPYTDLPFDEPNIILTDSSLASLAASVIPPFASTLLAKVVENSSNYFTQDANGYLRSPVISNVIGIATDILATIAIAWF